MIKTDDFIISCNCRTIGECSHNLNAEWSALNGLVDKTSEAMKRKLYMKFMTGWGGWDDPDSLNILKEKLKQHVEKDFSSENMIDVMNLAAMIWNQLQEEPHDHSKRST